jgi:hypothetical protein
MNSRELKTFSCPITKNLQPRDACVGNRKFYKRYHETNQYEGRFGIKVGFLKLRKKQFNFF